MEKISCVIPTYNRCPHSLEKKEHNPLWWCLASLREQTPEANLEEIIIVDDCSEDFTREVLVQFSKKTSVNLVYKKNERRLGSGQSRNLGVELAKNNLVFFLDDDCLFLDKKTLHKLNYAFSQLKKGKKVGAMALPVTSNSLEAKLVALSDIGAINREEGKMLGNHSKFPREYLADLGKYYLNKELDIFQPVEVKVMGGVFLCDKKAFEEAGGFPTFPWKNAYAEEPELVLNMQKHGWGVFYLPSLDNKFRIFHCKFGYPRFDRPLTDGPFSINGLSSEEIIKESAKKRGNTGNRVDKYDMLYSMVISDFWIMCKHVNIETGINSLISKYRLLVRKYPGDDFYLDLKTIPQRKRLALWQQAMQDGLDFLRKKEIIAPSEEEYIKKSVLETVGSESCQIRGVITLSPPPTGYSHRTRRSYSGL